MRTAYGYVLTMFAAACVSSQRTSTTTAVGATSAETATASRMDTPVEVVLRNTSWEDPELATKGLGRIEVVVRSADRPTQVLEGAQVQVKRVSDGTPSKSQLTDQRGIARFDSTQIGTYDMLVRRIGYAPVRGRITVSPGCRSDVEVYTGVQAIGLYDVPREPSRIRLTTCRVRK